MRDPGDASPVGFANHLPSLHFPNIPIAAADESTSPAPTKVSSTHTTIFIVEVRMVVGCRAIQ